MTYYQQSIRMRLAKNGYVGKYDPRHIEAFMRLGHPTLDGLSPKQFETEMEISRQCVDQCGNEESESCARSFGL